MILVRKLRDSEPLQFEVTVTEHGGQTQHHVSMSHSDHQRLSCGRCSPEQCVEAAFRFLLDRESNEAILRRFDINLIGRYFPEFEAQLPQYLPTASDAAGSR